MVSNRYILHGIDSEAGVIRKRTLSEEMINHWAHVNYSVPADAFVVMSSETVTRSSGGCETCWFDYETTVFSDDITGEELFERVVSSDFITEVASLWKNKYED